MKKIINGKRYDTETAESIGVDSYSNPGDFRHWREELFRKRTGEYFLYGAGGPMSQYAEQVELNSWSGGSKLIPLSYEQAQKWVEKHLDADIYEELFGVVEDLSKTTVTLSLRRLSPTCSVRKRRAPGRRSPMLRLMRSLRHARRRADTETKGGGYRASLFPKSFFFMGPPPQLHNITKRKKLLLSVLTLIVPDAMMIEQTHTASTQRRTQKWRRRRG